jgi:hypothetical protein
MTVNFPAVQPTACKFTPPQYPVTETRAQSGVRSYRLWGNLPSDAVLELQFTNISDFNAGAIVESYLAAKGPLEQVILPAIIFNGIEDETLLQILSQTSTQWFFVNQSAPTVERVPGRRSSVSVQLRAELRIST